ncbi:efflux RND transporter periplasmic adaptor subunit [Paracoccus sp. KR1-242]|uniref:efflux RND transporter periplasmic adaptor subunit n=1 Tax=Paracoccus sp. KR1-242 TaxID=3410028 RepID=UPI003C060F17
MQRRAFTPAVLVFAAIVILIVLWIGSGMIGRTPEQMAAPQSRVPVVAASWSEARSVDRTLFLYGALQPRNSVILRARTEGQLQDIVAQGTRVHAGDALGQLSMDDRPARIAQAQANLASVQRNAEASEQLANRGVRSNLEAQARQAELEAARAALQAVEIDIENTTLQAPFDGTVSRLIVEAGSFVARGGEVLEIVNNDPLLAIVQVQQSEIANVRPGMAARVGVIGGKVHQGKVSFVAPVADAATRTFRVEIEIPNPDAAIPAGISAEVTLIAETVPAHYISASLVRLDQHGRTGVLAVGDDNRILFRPVGFVAADAAGVWVGGLDAREHLVTISHGAIAEGEEVEVRETPPEFSLPEAPQAPGIIEVDAGPQEQAP